MKTLKSTLAIAVLVFSGAVSAGNNSHGHNKHDRGPRQDLFEYARVVEVQPIYREIKLSKPVRECWQEPVYHTRRDGHTAAGGLLAGGVIGSIIGHQIGKARSNKAATLVGTIIGAKIGHEAYDGQAGHEGGTVVSYEEHCRTRYQASYQEVVDGYDVTYKYRGRRYHIEMPYDPGQRIKMRIQFSPVI